MNTLILSLPTAAIAMLLVGCADQQPLAPSNTAARAPLERDVTTGSGCQLVGGVVTFTRFQFTSPTTAEGAGVFTGDISGTFTVQDYDLQLHGDGSGSLKGRHTLTTTVGTLETSDDDVLLPVNDPQLIRPIAHMLITSGTGAYAGATGQFMVQGEFNHVTLAGSLTFKGEICLP